MLALLVAAVLASAPSGHTAVATGASPLNPYLAKEMDWEKANLDTKGWNLVNVGTDVLIFLGPTARSRTGNPIVTVRGEHYPSAETNSIGKGESFLSRDEIDCAKTLERTVSSTIYSDSGLQGNIASASDDAGGWNLIKSGTFMAAAETALCPSQGVAH